MKLLNSKILRIYLLHPTLGKHVEEGLFSLRKGSKLQMDTGFTYLRANGELGSWLEFNLLGFGVAFYWNFDDERFW